MDHFEFRDGVLHAEDVPVSAIAEHHGTPCYVYSRATLTRHYHAFDQALAAVDHQVCYAVKANSNLAVLNVLARLGSGFDIVSGGELFRVLRAGGEPGKIVFSGVGKTADELGAALQAGIYCFNVESAAELEQLDAVARAQNVRARIALRVNPDVDARTHPYISTGLKDNKFGVDIGSAERLYQRARTLPGIEIAGIASHIGSQLLDVQPFLDALDRVLALVDRLAAAGIRCGTWMWAAAWACVTVTNNPWRRPTGPRSCCRAWRAAGSSSTTSPGAPSPATPACCSRACRCSSTPRPRTSRWWTPP